jgi:hypothetical protein
MVAYILVVAAAIIFTIRRRMFLVKTVILLVGLAVLGYAVNDDLHPVPAAPSSGDALAAAFTLVTGTALPFVYPPLRRGIQNSPLLKVGPARCSVPACAGNRCRARWCAVTPLDCRAGADRSVLRAWQVSQAVLYSLPGPPHKIINVDLVAEDGVDLPHRPALEQNCVAIACATDANLDCFFHLVAAFLDGFAKFIDAQIGQLRHCFYSCRPPRSPAENQDTRARFDLGHAHRTSASLRRLRERLLT